MISLPNSTRDGIHSEVQAGEPRIRRKIPCILISIEVVGALEGFDAFDTRPLQGYRSAQVAGEKPKAKAMEMMWALSTLGKAGDWLCLAPPDYPPLLPVSPDITRWVMDHQKDDEALGYNTLQDEPPFQLPSYPTSFQVSPRSIRIRITYISWSSLFSSEASVVEMEGLEPRKQASSTSLHEPGPHQGGSMFATEQRVLKERFSVWSTIGINYSIIATPLAIGSYLTFIIGLGGSPFFIYSYIVVAIGQLVLCLSMAEIAAVYPHASGQIFWTAALSYPNWSRSLSYWNGTATCLSWIFVLSGQLIFTSHIFLAAVEALQPGFLATDYQIYLLAVALGVSAVAMNVWFFNLYPYITKFMVIFINVSTVFIMVTLLVRTKPKASAKMVFTVVLNESGWDSLGVVFLLCFLPGVASVSCFDAPTHMSEEMPRPDRQVPQVMVSTAVLAAVSGFIMAIVYVFCTPNPEHLLVPVGGQPIFQVFKDGFRSIGFEAMAMVILCVVYWSSCPATLLTTSRVVWTFASHGGLWLGQWLGHVEPETNIPVHGVWATAILSFIIILLQFGPKTIINALLGAAAVCNLFAYGMPIWLLLLRGRQVLPANRYFSLGKAGIPLNVVASIWQLASTVFLCFPLYKPITLVSMNWAAAAAAVGFLFFAINWFGVARRTYHSPRPLDLPHMRDSEHNGLKNEHVVESASP